MTAKAALVVALAALSLSAPNAPANEIAQNKCAACHGVDGNSINPEWPSLAGQNAAYTASQLRAYQSGERENANMTAMVVGLTEADIVALGEYYAQLPPKIGQISADEVASGETLYRGGDKEKGDPSLHGLSRAERRR